MPRSSIAFSVFSPLSRTAMPSTVSPLSLYCWCKAVGYNTDGESSLCNTESPAWVFVEERADAPACADTCAQICAEAVRAPGGDFPDYDAFRSFLHGVQ